MAAQLYCTWKNSRLSLQELRYDQLSERNRNLHDFFSMLEGNEMKLFFLRASASCCASSFSFATSIHQGVEMKPRLDSEPTARLYADRA